MQQTRAAIDDIDVSELIRQILEHYRPVFAQAMHFVEKNMAIAMFVQILHQLFGLVAGKPQIVQTDIERLPGILAELRFDALPHQRGFAYASCAHNRNQPILPFDLIHQIAAKHRILLANLAIGGLDQRRNIFSC